MASATTRHLGADVGSDYADCMVSYVLRRLMIIPRGCEQEQQLELLF
jgi:hypothetical protein